MSSICVDLLLSALCKQSRYDRVDGLTTGIETDDGLEHVTVGRLVEVADRQPLLAGLY